MQQQSNVTNGQKQNSILVLLLNWIIILGVYLLIRIVFIVLGFHLNLKFYLIDPFIFSYITLNLPLALL